LVRIQFIHVSEMRCVIHRDTHVFNDFFADTTNWNAFFMFRLKQRCVEYSTPLVELQRMLHLVIALLGLQLLRPSFAGAGP
jgi:hypothetical protein